MQVSFKCKGHRVSSEEMNAPTQKNFEEKIHDLNKAGLNLFASMKVCRLPEDIKLWMSQAGLSPKENATLCLVGHGGSSLWENLPVVSPGTENRIDDYSIAQVKKSFPDARILFPYGQYHPPLQKIGRAFNLGRPSRLGIDINNRFGLWFAYRCLFLTEEENPEHLLPSFVSPCDDCAKTPCASESDFQKARLACPFQKDKRYSDEQIHYHHSVYEAWLKSGRNNS